MALPFEGCPLKGSAIFARLQDSSFLRVCFLSKSTLACYSHAYLSKLIFV